ncbi:MAG: hypothetical protein KDD25_05465 [Bdellovibrionales bacterium]|nr:hypothetical protein [Bdellovibrionales bacterium]
MKSLALIVLTTLLPNVTLASCPNLSGSYVCNDTARTRFMISSNRIDPADPELKIYSIVKWSEAKILTSEDIDINSMPRQMSVISNGDGRNYILKGQLRTPEYEIFCADHNTLELKSELSGYDSYERVTHTFLTQPNGGFDYYNEGDYTFQRKHSTSNSGVMNCTRFEPIGATKLYELHGIRSRQLFERQSGSSQTKTKSGQSNTSSTQTPQPPPSRGPCERGRELGPNDRCYKVPPPGGK